MLYEDTSHTFHRAHYLAARVVRDSYVLLATSAAGAVGLIIIFGPQVQVVAPIAALVAGWLSNWSG